MNRIFQNSPMCPIHNLPVSHFCASASCHIPNPMICEEENCLNSHGHPLQQIISIKNLKGLLEEHTNSMNLLMKKCKDYYKEVRELICHQIQKKEDLMKKGVELKYSHPVFRLLQSQKYNEISPLKIHQLISYLGGKKEDKSSLLGVKDEIYKETEALHHHLQEIYETNEFKSLLLFQVLDLSSINPSIKLHQVHSTIISSSNQLETINKMLKKRYPKAISSWTLLFKASEHDYRSSLYLKAIHERGPLLMIFETNKKRKFGCFLNCKASKKEGWMTDGTGESFIFSLDHNMIYPIKEEAKYRVKAFYVGQKGPQIGLGCDIYIADRCDISECGSNIGGSFSIPNYLFYGSKDAKCYLAGEENFFLGEYEVYELN